jgi:hypothetical protein
MGEWEGTKTGNYVLNWIFTSMCLYRCRKWGGKERKLKIKVMHEEGWEFEGFFFFVCIRDEKLYDTIEIFLKLNWIFFYNWNRLFLGLVLGTESFHSNQLFENIFLRKAKSFYFLCKPFVLIEKFFFGFSSVIGRKFSDKNF